MPELEGTYIVYNSISFGHQTCNSRRVNDLAVRAIQAGPKGTDMHLELIEAESPYGLQQSIKVVLEPFPDLARRNALRSRAPSTNGLLDRWELGEAPD